MKVIESEAIVLKNFSLAEADKIIVCFAQKTGLVRLGVRGAKRLSSRFCGRLEPFTVVELIYSQKEETELGRLFQAEVVKSHFHLASQLNILSSLSYLSEIFLVITPSHEPNEVLYRMVRACLAAIDALQTDLSSVRLVVVYFEIWLLRLAGFLPDFQRCHDCRASAGKTVLYYLPNEARLTCAGCIGEGRREFIMPPRLLKVLRAALIAPPLKFVKTANENEVERVALENITHRLLRKILEYEPPYWSSEFDFEPIVARAANAESATGRESSLFLNS